MKEVLLQKHPKGYFVPHSLTDKAICDNYKDNQIVKAKISGVKKPRSYDQLKMYWGCCNVVAENTDDIEWNDKDKVDFQVRVALRFYKKDRIKVVGKQVLFELMSISFKNLPHMEACGFFDRAFEVMAKFLKIPIEELKRNAE